MSGIKNIILETRAEELENLLSPFIREQFPNFIRTDYPKLVLFIKAYYEWMEQQGNAGYIVSKMDTIYDIDANADEFYDHFKRTYLASFPELFAVNPDGKTPNKKTLLKKIRDFYGNKGTESAYKFLFRILYDSDLELYYPKTDVLKASDGQWIEPRSIKTTSGNGSNLFGGKNGQIYQYDGTQLVASAFINSVVQYSFNGLPVTEFFITDINGTFTPDQTVIISKDGSEWSETAYSVLGQFFIELPGNGYRIGDTVTVTDSRGVGFAAKIEQTGLAGSIKKIGISNSGLNYSGDVLVNIFSEAGAQSAKVFALRSAVTNYAGYFSGNRGKVSSNKKIQDGHYYQDFSYELKSEVSLDTYFNVLKKIIHPAGMRMFGSVLVKKAIDNTVTSSAQATYSEIPVVGRYTPYALRTFNDLRGGYFLPNQVRGATLQVWLSAYNIPGTTSQGITADWGYVLNNATVGSDGLGAAVTTDDIWGITSWTSLVGGHIFYHSSAYPNSTVWLTPAIRQESVNTHSSVDIRPIQYNFSGPSSLSSMVSLGFSGPTMGLLGLTLSTSYFAVAKPRRIGTMNNFGANQNGNVLLGDRSSYRGILFGVTGGDITVPKIAAFSWRSAGEISGIVGSIGTTGEWKLISHTLTCSTGNSGPMSLFVDGVCLGTVAQAWTPAAANASAALQIGQQRFDSLVGAFDGEIAEILCYQGDVGESDRQKIEGYLAHKYGLADNLPAAHPYKNTVPGGSYSSGKWYGTTGDFYPNGYNPYIGSTAQTGVDGTTAPLGSQFLDSGLGYTYTVCNEFGVTAHNPTGSPLGGTAAWYANRESNLTPQGMNGLVLWLKPENIGVCGSVANGASADVWTDASPSANHALPPTWDKWNGIFTSTLNSGAAQGVWTRQVYTTDPITRLQWVFNGLCGGFTTDRLMAVGLGSSPSSSASIYSIDYSVYSYGPYSSGNFLNAARRIIAQELSIQRPDLFPSGAVHTAYDNTIFEIEYVEPNIVYRADGVVKRTVFAGYGRTFYMDSSFHNTTPHTARNGHCFTILGMWNGNNPVVPTASTVNSSAGISSIVYAGVTVDKLRPTLQTAGFGGATGVSFNGGIVFAPASVYAGVTLGGVVGLGYTTGTGSSAAAMLTGQHLYLKRSLKITDDADIFVVYKSTRDGLSYGYGLLGSRNTNCDLSANPSVRFDSVLFSRSYNEQDRTAAQQTSAYYSILPNGTVMYPGASLPPTGVFGFRPSGDQTSTPQNTIVYDPHVSGACLGICVGEAVRDSQNKIDVFLNGDQGLNKSRSTGRRVASVSPPNTEDYLISKNLVYSFDAGKTACVDQYISGFSGDLLRNQSFVPTPINVLKPVDPVWLRGDPSSDLSAVRVTQQEGTPALGADEVYKITLAANRNFYITNTAAWRDTRTATAWTFSVCVRKLDGTPLPADTQAYIHSFGTSEAAQATIENIGDGWYRVSRTKTGASESAATLVGLAIASLSAGTELYVSRFQLLPYALGDIDGRASRTTSSYPSWATLYGSPMNNSIERYSDPWGNMETVWRAENHSTISTNVLFNQNGGFFSGAVPIIGTKKYRYSVWVNRRVLGNGTFYFGAASGSYTSKFDGTVQTNPYFTANNAGSAVFTGKENTWILVVGHVHPFGTATGADDPQSGFYVRSGNGLTYASLSNYNDLIWGSAAASASQLRVLHYQDNTPGAETLFFRPRIDVVDGTEPSIEDLLNNGVGTVYDTSPSGAIGSVLGRPAIATNSIVFDGKTTVITTNSDVIPTNREKMTWEAWVKPSTPTDGELKMFAGSGGLPYYGALPLSNIYYWSMAVGGQRVVQWTAPYNITSRWTHLVFISDYSPATSTTPAQTRLQMYANGSLVREAAFDGAEVYSARTVSVGDRQTGTQGFYTTNGTDYRWLGDVSMVRVYSRAMTPEEILQNFNSTRGRFGL
jgi:hypothetical protein